MKRIVLDASGLLAWFGAEKSRGSLRSEYEQGLLTVVTHRQLTTHVLGVLGARGDWTADRLVRVAAELDRLEFERREPPMDEVAAWVSRGLSANQAGYAALASSLDLPLVTADPEVLSRARTVARSIADA